MLNACRISCLSLACLLIFCWSTAAADEKKSSRKTPDEQLAEYFEQATSRIEKQNAKAFADPEEWKKNQEVYRGQLGEMLGISPLPERTPLQVKVTKEIDEPDVLVKNLHYQAMPGLYVTGNLYLPKNVEKPCPAILYVCGHSVNKKAGVSYGNKVGYHHHGLWFARNGYVCLIIDTIQLGEFQGIHHGTHHLGMWWWNSRGYTPAGVETWAGMRGIDYLQSLPEVDPELIGVTGRSGGGGYSWYIAAMDTRVKAAVPVAGLTNMRNHIVDGCIAGHCDCMYLFNTYAWDFPQVAALIAPRALLIANTDKDPIFPLDGVIDLYFRTKPIYDSYGAGRSFGVAIAEGGHVDTQRLQVNAFEWFNRFLKKDTTQAENTAKRFDPEQLRVFQELPADERTSKIHDTFIPVAQPVVPKSAEEWKQLKQAWKQQLQQKTFAAWPEGNAQVEVPVLLDSESAKEGGRQYLFSPQESIELSFVLQKAASESSAKSKPLTIVLSQQSGDEQASLTTQNLQELGAGDVLLFSPRGLGLNAWSGDEKAQTHIRRRFALLGQTLDGMRLWDVCQLIRAVKQLPEYKETPIHLKAEGDLAGIALYAPLYVSGIESLELTSLPLSHHAGPEFLNVLKTLDLPQALALAAEKTSVVLKDSPAELTEYLNKTTASLKKEGQFSLEVK